MKLYLTEYFLFSHRNHGNHRNLPCGMFILMQITQIMQIFPFFRYFSVSSVLNILCANHFENQLSVISVISV